MRAEPLVEPRVRAFAEQVVVERAEHRAEGVGVVDVPRRRRGWRRAARYGGAAPGSDALEEARGVAARERPRAARRRGASRSTRSRARDEGAHDARRRRPRAGRAPRRDRRGVPSTIALRLVAAGQASPAPWPSAARPAQARAQMSRGVFADRRGRTENQPMRAVFRIAVRHQASRSRQSASAVALRRAVGVEVGGDQEVVVVRAGRRPARGSGPRSSGENTPEPIASSTCASAGDASIACGRVDAAPRAARRPRSAVRPKMKMFSAPTRSRISTLAPSSVPMVSAPLSAELHVAGARGLHARRRDLLGQVRRRDDRLGEAHVVVRQEHDLQPAAHRGVAVDDARHVVGELDDQLGLVVARPPPCRRRS